MSARTRSAAAEVGAAALVAALVLCVYLLALAVEGSAGGPAASSATPVFVATVLVALFLQPVFLRVRRLLRRRLDAPSAAPFDFLRRLPESVTGELPVEDIPPNMVRVVAEGLRAHRVELWLRTPGGHRLAASWPAGREPPAVFDPTTDALCEPIRSGERELAVLVLEHRPPRPLSRLERRLLDAYAAQAGQVVTMLTLRAGLEERRVELAGQQEALREARAQLLESQEVERRLLERDLHDGAQQQLLALALGVRLARQVRDRSPDRARELVARAAAQAGEVAAALRTLSASLYPRLLETEGLAAALRATLAGNTVPVVVREAPNGALAHRPPRDVVEALYFAAVEAVHNATRHADAAEVWVVVSRTAHDLAVTVTDRGRGFDPTAVTPGAGLRNMAERAAALGGLLDVVSAPGRGTVVSVSVPAPAPTAAEPDRPTGAVPA